MRFLAKMPRSLFWVVGILLVWKVIRTDWVVDYHYKVRQDQALVTETYSIAPPLSPLWRPPQPSAMEHWATTWESLFPKDAHVAPGTLGKPRLHPYWLAIGVKLFGTFAVLYPLVRWLSLKPSLTPAEINEP